MKELIPGGNSKSISRIDQDQSAQRYYIWNRSLESLDKPFVLSQYYGNQADLNPSTMPSPLSRPAPTTARPRQSKETGNGTSRTLAHPASHRWAGWGRSWQSIAGTRGSIRGESRTGVPPRGVHLANVGYTYAKSTTTASSRCH
jgi:hypothetical protein